MQNEWDVSRMEGKETSAVLWVRNPKRQFTRPEGCAAGVLTDWNGSSGKTDVRTAPRYWLGKLTTKYNSFKDQSES